METKRHESQTLSLTKLLALREAIISLPPDAEASIGHTLLFLDRPLFLEKFRGFEVRQSTDGCMFVDWNGVLWASVDPSPRKDTIVKL